MKEGNLHQCCWKKYKQGISIWVKNRPEIKVEALNFNDAAREIAEQICIHLGDGEPLLDFTPPPPDRYLVLLFNHSSDLKTNVGDLFENGVCSYCKCPRGPRTNKQLLVRGLPNKANITEVTAGLRIIPLYSEKFLGALSLPERNNLQFTEALTERKCSQKFYEISAKPTVFTVFAKAIHFEGWKCPKCGSKRWGHYRLDDPIHDYIASEDVSDSMQCFTVENGTMKKLVMTPERYARMQKLNATRGIVADPLGVLNDGQYIRDPKLPLIKN